MREGTPQSQRSQDTENDLRELVIARLDVLPPDKKISVGSDGQEFDKVELIDHVRKGDEIGKKVINLELTFLQALKDGRLLRDILTAAE